MVLIGRWLSVLYVYRPIHSDLQNYPNHRDCWFRFHRRQPFETFAAKVARLWSGANRKSSCRVDRANRRRQGRSRLPLPWRCCRSQGSGPLLEGGAFELEAAPVYGGLLSRCIAFPHRRADSLMILRARFPVFLREVRPPGFRNRGPSVIFLDTTVDIREVSSAEAPVALHATAGHFVSALVNVFEFRFMDGRFYRPLRTSLEAFEGVNLREPWGRPHGLQKLVDEIYVAVLPHAKKAYPVGVLDILQGKDVPNVNQVSFIDRSAKTEITDSNEETVEAAKRRFEEQCSSYVVIDGKVWVECIEPLLSVEMDARSPEYKRISIFAGELPRYSPLLAREYLPSSVQLFSFAEFETVQAMARRSSSPKAVFEGARFSVISHDPFCFSNDFPYIQDGVRMLWELQSDGEVSKDMIIPVAEFLANDANWTYDGVEELLQDCLSTSKPGSEAKLFIPSMLERFRDRPISLDVNTRQSTFGLR